jgi:hypothetical protein
MGKAIALVGFVILLFNYFDNKPNSWSYLGWAGMIIGAIIIYLEWKRGYGKKRLG